MTSALRRRGVGSKADNSTDRLREWDSDTSNVRVVLVLLCPPVCAAHSPASVWNFRKISNLSKNFRKIFSRYLPNQRYFRKIRRTKIDQKTRKIGVSGRKFMDAVKYSQPWTNSILSRKSYIFYLAECLFLVNVTYINLTQLSLGPRSQNFPANQPSALRYKTGM